VTNDSIDPRDYFAPPRILRRDDKVALVAIRVNEKDPHLRIRDQRVCHGCADKDCTHTCPIDNYVVEADGRTTIYWDSCLECGACRVTCPYGNIDWKWPTGGYGVSYRYG
jgi:ferredoxin like protein